MNKAHHDRIAFMRISSGKFDATKEVYHVQSGRKLRLSQPQQIMAQDRKVIDEAYAGDVIGVFDPGISLSEIRYVRRERNSSTRESRPLHRNISADWFTWIR